LENLFCQLQSAARTEAGAFAALNTFFHIDFRRHISNGSARQPNLLLDQPLTWPCMFQWVGTRAGSEE
jgi:hypothetical protein